MSVELQRGADYVLTVRDDGKGFDVASHRGDGHIGLKIMRERAQRSGGAVDIASAPGAGTVVTLRLPVARLEAAA